MKLLFLERLAAFCSLLFIAFSPLSIFAQDELIKIGEGNYSFITVTTSDNQSVEVGENTLSATGLLPNLNAASRFLAQSSFGADYETIESVANQGFTGWIDDQQALPNSFSFKDFVLQTTERRLDSLYANNGDPTDAYPRLDYYHWAWWQNAMQSPDLLRARVALALSEIFVVSEIGVIDDYPLAIADYYDMLSQHAFGNFRDLLYDVTMHPAMGAYLTCVNNPKADPNINRFPDENYAREIMQLFTIGLYELYPNGTRRTDQLGRTLSTYDNNDIAELAKVFTGLMYGDSYLFGQAPASQYTYTMPMKMNNYWHEPATKYLLNGYVINERGSPNGMADINEALDMLFNHDNVAPFITIRLIQRLVKSNPSPEYVARVAAVFNNSNGVRGDLGAVVKAILLDPEARSCNEMDNDYAGMLREPIVRYTHLARAFNAAAPNGEYRNEMDRFVEETGQRPMGSPTVFNFFQPGYQPLGAVQEAGLVAPEFQIINSQTSIGYLNELHEWLFDRNLMEWFRIYGNENNDDGRVELDLSTEIALVEEGKIEEMIERVNLIMLHGMMSDRTRKLIVNGLTKLDQSDADEIVQTAIFLAMVAPDYLIFR
ncbi:MAG: DUF1800 family protein [Saprospiraceae bacterium]